MALSMVIAKFVVPGRPLQYRIQPENAALTIKNRITNLFNIVDLA